MESPIAAVLVDDEPGSLRTLQLLLKKHCPEVEVMQTFSNPKTALKEIPKLQPQLLFLDIEMPGMNGFDLLSAVKGFTGHVIFVTAHSDYALRAIKFSALDYLLKPVDATELKKAVAKFKQQQSAPPAADVLKQMLSNMDFMAQETPHKIAVNTQDGIEVVLFDDINYLKADRNYTSIHRQNHKPLMVAKPLLAFEEVLPARKFMRIHTSYVINLQKVERYMKAEGGYAVMRDGHEITVGRTHKEEFLEYLKQ